MKIGFAGNSNTILLNVTGDQHSHKATVTLKPVMQETVILTYAMSSV
jgi:hypothetical protein